jgi:hypothetical protein
MAETKRWVACDEDCETGFLIGAADLSAEDALAEFLRLWATQIGGDINAVDGEPLFAELRPFREPRPEEDAYGYEEALIPCTPSENPTEQVWVIEGIEWID